jgi:L,D-transpeptidase YcbB
MFWIVKVQIMKQWWRAALGVAVFMITVSPFEASAQRSRLDDWLRFDQPDDSWDRSPRDGFTAREHAQPERGFPTLAKENIAATKNAIKQYTEIATRGGWPQLPMI